jgi:hypothetical protein
MMMKNFLCVFCILVTAFSTGLIGAERKPHHKQSGHEKTEKKIRYSDVSGLMNWIRAYKEAKNIKNKKDKGREKKRLLSELANNADEIKSPRHIGLYEWFLNKLNEEGLSTVARSIFPQGQSSHELSSSAKPHSETR